MSLTDHNVQETTLADLFHLPYGTLITDVSDFLSPSVSVLIETPLQLGYDILTSDSTPNVARYDVQDWRMT